MLWTGRALHRLPSQFREPSCAAWDKGLQQRPANRCCCPSRLASHGGTLCFNLAAPVPAHLRSEGWQAGWCVGRSLGGRERPPAVGSPCAASASHPRRAGAAGCRKTYGTERVESLVCCVAVGWLAGAAAAAVAAAAGMEQAQQRNGGTTAALRSRRPVATGPKPKVCWLVDTSIHACETGLLRSSPVCCGTGRRWPHLSRRWPV